MKKYRKALEEQRLLDNVDGTLSLRQAMVAEAAAVQEYRRVLKIFTELTIEGKVPPPD